MESNIIQKIISMLPEGERRNALMQKMNAATRSKQNTGGGLHDEFAFKPKGHIMIEEIDANGQVLGVLADQPNLVVKGSEEILLRAFSGDPKRTLYKNRKIKEYKNESNVLVDGISKPYNVSLEELTIVLNDEDVVPFHQNEIWKAVKDEDFDIEYSYYPNTLYVKAEALPLEPDMITFRLYNKDNAPVGAAPLQAEVYSNYSNLFIGLGDGRNKRIAFTDERLNITGFTEDEDTLLGNTVGSKVEFSAKITNIRIVAEGEGAIKVIAGGVDRGTISFDNGEEAKVFEVVDLDGEVETNVVIEMITGPKAIIKEIAFDEFSVHDNALMGEFENHTLRFDTPTVYNANTDKGPSGTFTIQLNHEPIVAESLVVKYNGEELTAADSIEAVKTGEYFLEANIGRLHLSEPLTGVLVSYSVTGEIHEDEPHTALATGSVSAITKTIEESGDVDLSLQLNGVNTEFNLGYERINSPETLVVELDGVAQAEGTNYTVDAETGKLTIIPVIIPAVPEVPEVVGSPAVPEVLGDDGVTVVTPAIPEVIGSPAIPAIPEKTVIPDSSNTLIVKSFSYEKHTPGVLNTYVMQLKAEVKDGAIRVLDHTGKELEKAEVSTELSQGKFLLREDSEGKLKELVVVKENTDIELIQKVEVYYSSIEKPGEETNYTRQVIEKPKNQNEYPWFQLDKGKIVFVAEFPENSPGHNVTIREMGLFDGPRSEDEIRGFNNYNVKAFSLVRVGETRKEATTGLRVTWTITLLNEEGMPFKGGF